MGLISTSIAIGGIFTTILAAILIAVNWYCTEELSKKTGSGQIPYTTTAKWISGVAIGVHVVLAFIIAGILWWGFMGSNIVLSILGAVLNSVAAGVLFFIYYDIYKDGVNFSDRETYQKWMIRFIWVHAAIAAIFTFIAIILAFMLFRTRNAAKRQTAMSYDPDGF